MISLAAESAEHAIMSEKDDDRIMEDAVRIMGDTVGTPEGFTPNCCVLSWRLRLGYAEL